MCGIAGILASGLGARELEARLHRMNAAQRCRGPDDAGVWVGTGVGLAAVRLHVTGGTAEGRQPLRDRWDGRTVFNGEIYGFRRVLAQLDEPATPDVSDGTALACLLVRCGPSKLADVSGMFAAGRYDPVSRRLLLVRDAFGKKPVYLRAWAGGIAFASTIAALRAGTGPLEVRPAALQEYAVFRSVGGHRSAFSGVSQLPPGSWLVVDEGGRQESGRWWTVPVVDEDAKADPDDLAAELDAAVAARTATPHETGVFVSGGLDSAAVAASLARQAPACGAHVYMVGYETGEDADERRFAGPLAEWLDVASTSIEVRDQELPELLEAVCCATEDPIADPITLPTLALCRAARTRTKVVLTGDGADELWGGYARFDGPHASLTDYLRQTTTFLPEELGLARYPDSYLDQVDPPPAARPPLDSLLRFEAANRMRNYHLARIDKIGMSVGLEVRVPFLDIRFATRALRLAASVKRPDGRPKGLLVDAIGNRLPGWLRQRRKQPFSAPVRAWMRGPLRELAHDVLLGPSASTGSLVRADHYLRDLEPGAPGADARALRAWSLLQLEVWLRTFARQMGPEPGG